MDERRERINLMTPGGRKMAIEALIWLADRSHERGDPPQVRETLPGEELRVTDLSPAKEGPK